VVLVVAVRQVTCPDAADEPDARWYVGDPTETAAAGCCSVGAGVATGTGTEPDRYGEEAGTRV